MTFKLSKRSLKNLEGVHPDLVKVVKRALEISEEDFMVGEGVRSYARQKKLRAAGKSKTLKSKHLVQSDGYGHAVDLWHYKEGGISWDVDIDEPYYKLLKDDDYTDYQEIGTSVLKAAEELGVKIRWGADWDSDGAHNDHSFLDWVHFELVK